MIDPQLDWTLPCRVCRSHVPEVLTGPIVLRLLYVFDFGDNLRVCMMDSAPSPFPLPLVPESRFRPCLALLAKTLSSL